MNKEEIYNELSRILTQYEQSKENDEFEVEETFYDEIVALHNNIAKGGIRE